MKTTLLFILTALFVGALWSQESDTAKVYHLKEVVVTATRSEIALETSPSPVDVIARDDIVKEIAKQTGII